MGVSSARPEWTRGSPGIPVDTVIRLHTGSQGALKLNSLGAAVVSNGSCGNLVLPQQHRCKHAAQMQQPTNSVNWRAGARQDVQTSRRRVAVVRPGSLQPKP